MAIVMLLLNLDCQKKKKIERFLKKEKIPIQFQIQYTRKDKSKLIRVISGWLKVTDDRKVAESDANVSILALNAVQYSARLAQEGNVKMGRSVLLSTTKLLQRIAQSNIQQEEYSNFVSMSEDLDTSLLNLLRQNGTSMNDSTVKTLQKMKTISIVPFMAGSKKEKIVLKRKKHTKSATTTNN